ncbi:hypothetical protein AMJ85_11035 [candidate division BRC1 bacterium SM23_51]|nr:MAG: hypothetical protein AMJ85_11035 [candidate division BRC1 bacterium SM23_51]
MGKRYADPPIVEAVCEFRLTPATKWDLTIPGLIYAKVKEDFPNKEQRPIQEVEFTQSQEGTQQQIRASELALFLAENRETFIQVGPRLLAVNRLKPYHSWARFKPSIEKAFGALTDTVDVEGLQRIGLLYINRIEIPGSPVDLDKYFEFRPFLGDNLPQDMANFFLGCRLPFRDGKELCRVELISAVPENPNSVAILLRLDYHFAHPNVVRPDGALEWVEAAHSQVEEIFEGCITDRLREIFQELE